MMEKKLGFLYLLKKSLNIPFKNPTFVIFTFLTSLPLFYFLVVHEIVFQETLIETVKILQETTAPLETLGALEALGAIDRLIEEVSHKFLVLGFLNMGILHFLDLFNTIAIVDVASMIYKGEKAMNLWDMLSRLVKETRLKGPLITSIYVLLLASLTSVGLVSLVAYVYIASFDGFVLMLFLVVFIALLTKYIEWCVVWNMGIVISVLEEKHGDVALVISAHLSRSTRHYGHLLMFVFFAWRLALRLSNLYVGWDTGGSGVVITAVHISFVCLANVLNWLIIVVYFFYCKRQSLEKKIEVEAEHLSSDSGAEHV